VKIDRERAAALGVSHYDIASEIRYALYGATATTMDTGDDRLDIVVTMQEEDMSSLDNINSLFVISRSGQKVFLSHVTNLVEGRSPIEINREQLERVIHVTGDLAPGIAATEFEALLQNVVTNNIAPREGVEITFGGEAQEIREFSSTFIWIILAALFLVFGVMASQFESFVDPFIIFFSIPLLAIGVVWMYRFSGEPFSLFSAVGVVALVGIVVNNGIVLVDYTNLLRARGLNVREACLEAGQNRLRPILMTSLTTILGMVPLAFFPGAGAETIQPIGKTLVGGLAVSSILTPFVTPVMYSILNRRHDKRKQKRAEAARQRVASSLGPQAAESLSRRAEGPAT
jgi:HAE1 family hydrophobic/amphiphilic exporter-1